MFTEAHCRDLGFLANAGKCCSKSGALPACTIELGIKVVMKGTSDTCAAMRDFDVCWLAFEGNSSRRDVVSN